jgi:hypothetical protein
MSLPPKIADRLFDLLSQGWDGDFSPDGLAEIEAIVAEYGQPASEKLVEFSTLHVDLNAIVASSRAYEQSISRIVDMAGAEGAPRHVASLTVTPASSDAMSAKPSRLWQWTLATVASLAVLAAGAQIWRGGGAEPIDAPVSLMPISLVRPPQPVACVSRVRGAKWEGDARFRVGSTIEENQRLVLVEGTAQISMACGADVVLQAPCSAVLVSDALVMLERGKVTAQAAAWATGFVVEAKGLRVTDLGTRFAVSVDANGVAEAHVLEGKVLAEPMKEHRPKRSSMLLSSGEALRVSLPLATIDLIAAERDKFVDQLPMFRPLRPIQIWNTGVGKQRGEGDSHWRITAGDATCGPYPRPAIITPGDPAYLDNKPDASQWISVHDQVYPGLPAESVHTFETRFDLTGYDLDTVRIVGLFLVDDAINELRINGKAVPFERWVTTWDVFDFKSFHPIEIKDGFVPGENVISIDVYNSPSHPDNPTNPNPMSLRVEWQAFGCEAGLRTALVP